MGAPTLKAGVLTYFVAENCIKMKKNWTGARPRRPLDPPMILSVHRGERSPAMTTHGPLQPPPTLKL